MRAALLVVLALVLAGCARPPQGEPRVEAAPPTATTVVAAANETSPPIGERRGTAMERFVLTPDHGLEVEPAGAPPREASRVPETLAPVEFYKGMAQDIAIRPWASEPFGVPFEAAQDITITLSFVSDQPAASTTKAASFSPVGGWMGTPDRYAVFFSASSAPDTLEAGKVYTVTMTATPPPSGMFFRAGESLALHTFLSYQTASGGAASYVVGGPAASHVLLPHEHFNVSAPVGRPLVEKTGAFQPHPGVTSNGDPSAASISIEVPPEAVYVVLELTARATSGRLDADLHVLQGGEDIGAGTGPNAKEVVVIGPTALAQGRSLVARVQSASVSGGSWTLTATAFTP